MQRQENLIRFLKKFIPWIISFSLLTAIAYGLIKWNEIVEREQMEEARSAELARLEKARSTELARMQLVWSAPAALVKDCPDCPEMVTIPAGSFEMGLEDGRPGAAHFVTLPSFMLGKTEVTQGQWKAIMGNNPSRNLSCGDECPVESMTWSEAQDFARRIGQKTGKGYRLPTEAEWEYAARAGSITKWHFGDNAKQMGEYAWFKSNSISVTHRVAQKIPNSVGLYDMYGNVSEWTLDCWHDTYAGAPTDGSAWISACVDSRRILRGGSWDDIPVNFRSADFSDIKGGNSSIGFRLARTLSP